MTNPSKNTAALEWEEHAAVVVAGSVFSERASEEEKSGVYRRLRIWNALFAIALLIALYAISTAIYEQQTDRRLLDLALAAIEPGATPSNTPVEQAAPAEASATGVPVDEEASGTPPSGAITAFDFGNLQSYIDYFSGYWGLAKWMALSLILVHLQVRSMVQSAFHKVVRHWRFMLSHSEDHRAKSLAAPQTSQAEREAMVATTFYGFWRKVTRGVPITPFGMRMLLSLLFLLIYTGLVYAGVLPSPLG